MHSACHVEKRFVDGDALHVGSEVTENRHHPIGKALVFGEVPVHEDEVGTQLLGAPARHAALHAEGLGLVRGGEYDAAAHRNRAPTKLRIEELLDRRVERVEIGVQDCRQGCHPPSVCEQMFDFKCANVAT